MGSKGRIPAHIRRPLAGPEMIHPDPYGPAIHPPPGAFPPFDLLPPPEIMEQKLATQHVEMQRLATENQRLAATHVSLRQELAAAQHELQRLQAQIGALKNEKEQQMRGLMDKIGKMEVDLQAADSLKMDLQQAHADAQGLMAARQELISKVQQLTQDLQRSRSDVQQIPGLMSELEGLRQEYQHCRATYDYERKLYNDHYESLQVMEKNYMSMSREVEKLRAELANAANLERRSAMSNQNAGGPYGGSSTTGYKENDAAGHHLVGQTAYEDGYGVPQHGRGSIPGAAAPYAGAPPGSAPPRAGYDTHRGPAYDSVRGPAYDSARGPAYDAARGGPGYDAVRGGPGYNAAGGAAYDAGRASGYDAPSRNAVGHQGQAAQPGANAPYGSATPPTRAGPGYEAPPSDSRGANPARR